MSLRDSFHVADRHMLAQDNITNSRQILESIIEHSVELGAAYDHAPKAITKGRNYLQIFMDDAMDAFVTIMAQPFVEKGYDKVEDIPAEDFDKIPVEFYLKLMRERFGPARANKVKAIEALKEAVGHKLKPQIHETSPTPDHIQIVLEELSPQLKQQLLQNWVTILQNLATLLFSEEAFAAQGIAKYLCEATAEDVSDSIIAQRQNQQGAAHLSGVDFDDDDEADDGQNLKIHRVEDLDAIDVEMGRLVGLAEPKEMIAELGAESRLKRAQELVGIAPEKDDDGFEHYIFRGNPGTGKTTFARLIGKIERDSGHLTDGHVVEVQAADIIAGFVRQTGPLVKKVVQQALGGVLFIDEAYLLMGEGNDFGSEAIGTLLKEMELHKDNLVVIFAGYPDLMNELIKSNPGLTRRLKFLDFPDFSMDELMEIFDMNMVKRGLKIDDDAREKVKATISKLKNGEGKHFGNAGTVVNLTMQLKRKLALHLQSGGVLDQFDKAAQNDDGQPDITPDLKDALRTITSDIVDQVKIQSASSASKMSITTNLDGSPSNDNSNDEPNIENDGASIRTNNPTSGFNL